MWMHLNSNSVTFLNTKNFLKKNLYKLIFIFIMQLWISNINGN